MTNHGGGEKEPEREPGAARRSRLRDLDGARQPAGAGAPEAPEPAGAGVPEAAAPGEEEDPVARRRREFAVLLGEFRRTAVLVPFDPYGSPWTADQGGVRWICAFSDEGALARFAALRGEGGREWTYRTILGARLLDAMVPALAVPAGVALDAGSGEGMLFPPVAGIVPDAAAVDPEGVEEAG
ncbi:SseB family protein [Streptomyces sp. NPDC001985]|uniref:SseB family protein n=1 Tax=Streptomyces sp. NPDC001985 TaxID=3154406 RepID=UPI00333314A0